MKLEDCSVRLCAALISLSLTRPQKLKFPCTHQICASPNGKAPHLANSPISRTRCTPSCPQLNCFHFSASLQNYSDKPITSSHRYLGSLHPPIITKPATAPTCSVCSQVKSNSVLLLIKKKNSRWIEKL